MTEERDRSGDQGEAEEQQEGGLLDPFGQGGRRPPPRREPPPPPPDSMNPFEDERRRERPPPPPPRRRRRRPPPRRGHSKGGGEAGKPGEAHEGEREGVRYHLTLEGVEGRWWVESIDLREGLSELYALRVVARVTGAEPLEAELRLRELCLEIERAAVGRSVRGLVREAFVEPAPEGARVTLEVVPAAWLFTHDRRSRVFQHSSIPALVERLYAELLGGRRRELRLELSAEHPVHEYLVQYEEPSFCFLERLLEEAGIAYRFEHEGEGRELLVLFDESRGAPRAPTEQGGALPLVETEAGGQEHEAVIELVERERIGANEVRLTGFDFSNPEVEVQAERRLGATEAERGAGPEPALEVHLHEGAARLHGYEGRQYRAHEAEPRARHEAERMALARRGWAMRATAIGLAPGRRFTLRSADEGEGEYLVISLRGEGEADPGAEGRYECVITCAPVELPYRPPRRRPRPRALGPETATVVGPAGEEIHTDEHGRVKVQLHWDREGRRDEHSSCWIRVSQSWAGPGWGTMFLPRIGMEVVVSFLRGDPDRPLVTGCVYNGHNPTPYALPEEKTKSTIKTSSSPGGRGFNELRFEDRAGHEEVFLHAEKDLNEVVKHCHSTRVGVDQSNFVRRDQREVVQRDQALTVEGSRQKGVLGDETSHVHGRRYEKVTGFDHHVLEDSRETEVAAHEHLRVGGSRSVTVAQSDAEVYEGGRHTTVRAHEVLVVEEANRSVRVGGKYSLAVEGQLAIAQGGTERIVLDQRGLWESEQRIHLQAPSSSLELKEGGEIVLACAEKLTLTCGEAAISLSSDGAVTIRGNVLRLEGGAASLDLSAEGATVAGPKVTTAAEGFNIVQGTLVRIN